MLILLICLSNAVDLRFKLPARQIRCFGDRLQEKEMIQGFVEGESADYSLKITDTGVNKQLYYTYHELTQKFTQLFNETTQIQICIHNLAHYQMNIQFLYEQGIQAELASIEDLKEIEKQVKQYNNTLQHLKSAQLDLLQLQTNRNEKMNVISSKIIIFSIITIMLMIVVTIISTIKAAKIMKLKKSY
ncbi:unnamed protein product [Paramecium pentaurelia]|uniref:GOLD domain-containing protein n=1 Tax=Paramecium pentaurelia TaxID=43138 RepID=A0A8S1W9N4_9CILI|nr:unnamed protein product [Paramecium pentaurelia]